jgi:hypothetical protein
MDYELNVVIVGAKVTRLSAMDLGAEVEGRASHMDRRGV